MCFIFRSKSNVALMEFWNNRELKENVFQEHYLTKSVLEQITEESQLLPLNLGRYLHINCAFFMLWHFSCYVTENTKSNDLVFLSS